MRSISILTALVVATGCSFDGTSGDGDGAEDEADAAITGNTCGAPMFSRQLESMSISNGPGLNGMLFGDWPRASSQSLDMETAPWKLLQEESVYDNSASLTVRSMHTATALYFGVEVTDPQLVEDDPGEAKPDDEDVILLFIDAAGDRSGVYGDDDHWIAIDAAANATDFGASPATVNVGTNARAGGWTAEIGISKAELGIDPSATSIGFNIAVVDEDGLAAGRDAVGLWDLPSLDDCVSVCNQAQRAPWCDTTMFAELTLP